MFILVVLSILLALDLFWIFGACWLQRRSTHKRRWRALTLGFALVQILGLLGVVALRFGGGAPSGAAVRTLAALVFIWHLLLLPVAVSTLWLGLGTWGVLKLGRFLFTRSSPDRSHPHESDGLRRREFLAATVAIAPPLLAAVSTGVGVAQLQRFRLRRVSLSIPQLPAALNGMTITHLSDLHVGPFTSGAVLDDVVRASNALAADLVVFTGDLVNTSLSELPDALGVVRRLEARYGVHVIEGNHDLIDNGREFEKRIRDAGVPFLLNETATVVVRGTPVQLLGLRWGSPSRDASRAENHGDAAVRASMAELLRLRDPDAFQILLAHHPHAFDPAAAAGIPLTLAGHTHGGQLMLNQHVGFGPLLFRYWSGLYRQNGSQMIVSNGIGNWFPLRTQAPAEIVHLTLRRSA